MSDWSDPRPMSPHLWSWRWHLTMATSILHRLTGFANIAGLLLFAGWLLAIIGGKNAYTDYVTWVGQTGYVQIVLMGCLLGFFFHLLNGIRYLFWDVGRGFDPAFANFISLLNIAGAIIGTAWLWTFL